MGRVVSERMVTRFSSGSGPSRRRDSLVGEEPLEIRIDGTSLVVTMRTPGNDYELAAGFLVSEGLIRDAAGFVRGSSLVAYSRPDRILATETTGEGVPGQAQRMVVR